MKIRRSLAAIRYRGEDLLLLQITFNAASIPENCNTTVNDGL